MQYSDFTDLVWEKGRELYRDMPWRRDTSPYAILVSELMLQQTQVPRVIPKYQAFMERFPTITALAEAPLGEVIRQWQGLGYNRRAKYLHMAAQQVVRDFGGMMPSEYEGLKKLPGIGPGTAGAIMTYAYNQPIAFIETNVRAVYFYHFFRLRDDVRDGELMPIIEATLDREHPREFYWALMDYGTQLKQSGSMVRNSQSRHYKKQSVFSGSLRQVRGQIIAQLSKKDMTGVELRAALRADERFEPALDGLARDGLVTRTGDRFHLA